MCILYYIHIRYISPCVRTCSRLAAVAEDAPHKARQLSVFCLPLISRKLRRYNCVGRALYLWHVYYVSHSRIIIPVTCVLCISFVYHYTCDMCIVYLIRVSLYLWHVYYVSHLRIIDTHQREGIIPVTCVLCILFAYHWYAS